MNYTKGEWKYKPANEKFWIICDHIGYECVVAEMTENIPEMQANAHLIAAAPDMYAALKTISAFYSDTGYKTVFPSMVEAVRKVNRALSKAEGVENEK